MSRRPGGLLITDRLDGTAAPSPPAHGRRARDGVLCRGGTCGRRLLPPRGAGGWAGSVGRE